MSNTITGHIRLRENKKGKTYQLVLERATVDGRRKRSYETLQVGTTKKEAEKRLREKIIELEQYGSGQPSKRSLKSWLLEFEEMYVHGKNLAPTTAASYEDAIRTYIVPVLGEVPLCELTPLAIQKWVNQISEHSPATGNPLSPKTVHNHYLCLKKALDIAVNMELLRENPALKITLPRQKKYHCEVYSDEQIRQLLDSVQGTDLELPIEMEISLGLRRGELLALKFSEIDFEKQTLTIAENVVSVRGKNHVKEPKTEAGRRTVRVNSVLIKKLLRQRADYRSRKLQMGADFHDTDLVFCKKNGEAYNADYFSRKFRRHLKRHNLPHMRFHDLRHICASVHLEQEINPKVISKILGHSKISTTLDIYSHVMERSSQEAVDKMEAYLYDTPQKPAAKLR